jgi:hypothetical protein
MIVTTEAARVCQKERADPAHLVQQRGVLLDVNGGLAGERERPEPVRRCG